ENARDAPATVARSAPERAPRPGVAAPPGACERADRAGDRLAARPRRRRADHDRPDDQETALRAADPRRPRGGETVRGTTGGVYAALPGLRSRGAVVGVLCRSGGGFIPAVARRGSCLVDKGQRLRMNATAGFAFGSRICQRVSGTSFEI